MSSLELVLLRWERNQRIVFQFQANGDSFYCLSCFSYGNVGLYKEKEEVVKSGFGIYFAWGVNQILFVVLASRKPFD